jgi:cation diffusion facilitator family transporter
MPIGSPFRFPDEQWEARNRAKRIAWLSVVLLLAASMFLAFALGQSQAMKTAWISDVLTAIPPATFLVALRYELRPPSRRFPYGYLRSSSISFLVTASVMLIIGLYLLVDSALKLVHQERPPIGVMPLFGHQLWAGWVMIAALATSMFVGLLLGKLKQPVAERLHGKAVEAESRMNRAEWMSEGAAIVGILLVGFGFWWGDALAAAFISLEIVRDGWQNMLQVVADVMDESPTKLGGRELEDIPARLRVAAEQLDWVERAAVRLREQGHAISGDVFVVPRDDVRGAGELVRNVESAARELERLDWRLHGLTVMPVSELVGSEPPRLVAKTDSPAGSTA